MAADRLEADAYDLVGKIQDAKWQKQRDMIAAYGRDCYNLGAGRLLDRLNAELAAEPCPKCGNPDCEDPFPLIGGTPCPGGQRACLDCI